METEKQNLLKVQEQLSKYFLFLSGRCKKLQRKCNKYLDKLQNTDELDVNVQKSGVRLIQMMKIFKGNMSVILNSFDNDLKEFDPEKNSKLFEEIYTNILDYKTTVVSLENDNKYVFTKLCDKETFTEENIIQTNSWTSSSTSDLDQTRSMNNSLVDCIHVSPNSHSSQNSASNELTQDVILISSESDIKAGCSSEENRCTQPGKMYNLSLQVGEESDGQDTDDSWTDSLKPYSPIEVKTRLSPKRQGEESEEDANDAETVDMNYEAESTPDDIFEDGHSTPKEEIIKEEKDSINSEELLSMKEEEIIDFREESNSSNKSKEVDMLFSEDFKEEPSISLKSEEIDMLFSEDSPPNATNPETSKTHETGKSSESVTNLENENSNNFLKTDKVIDKDALKTNIYKKNEACNKLNLVCDRSHSEKLLAHAGSNRSKSASPCILSENESNCSLETVNCSNNDSHSETGSRILKMPVEIIKSSNESKHSSGSRYTVHNTLQITKKTKPKLAKKVCSPRKLETPKKSQKLRKNQRVESDSGNITNSQSSTTSESTETSTSSLNDSDEQAKSTNSENIKNQDRRNGDNRDSTIGNLNKSDGQAESPNTKNVECQVSSNDDDEDSAVANLKYFDEQTKSSHSENRKCSNNRNKWKEPVISNLNNHDDQLRSPNSETIEWEDSCNEDDGNSDITILKDCDERAGSSNSVHIEYEHSSNDEDEDSAVSNLNNSIDRVELPNSANEECQDKKNNDDDDYDIANIKDFDERSESPNSENIEDSESSNDEDKGPAVAIRNNSYDQGRNLENINSRNEGYEDSAIANLQDHDGQAKSSNLKSTESLHSRNYEDEGPVNANLSNSDDHLADANSRNSHVKDYNEQAESPNLESIECLDSRNVSAIAKLNSSDEQPCSPNCGNIQVSPIRNNGKESAIAKPNISNKAMESLNSDKIEYQLRENDNDTESTIANINDSNELEEIPNSENIDSDATVIGDDETVDIHFKSAEDDNIYSMATQVISNIDKLESENDGDRSSCISDTHDGNANTEELNTVQSKYIRTSGKENSTSDRTDDVYSLDTQDLSVMETPSVSQSTKNKYDFEEAEADDIYSKATQVISNIDKIQTGTIGDRTSCMSDSVSKYCNSHETPKNTQELNTVDSKSIEGTSSKENNDVSNEVGDVYSLATQELPVLETNSRNPSKSENESIEPDLNERENNDVAGEIENPFSVETIKLVSDEDVDESDSQSSRISEKFGDFLCEHNYSCASASDLDDSTRNERVGPDPEMEDSDSGETGNAGVLRNVDKVDSELNIEDTINMSPEAETDGNGVASPTSPLEKNVTGDCDSKNSQSELTDIVDTSYIYSEHNYSSCGSPGTQNSSSDMEDEVTENSFADVHRQISTDADSDETDIDREVNEDLVNESEDVKLQLEKVLANLDEIPDSQEDVALSQQSTKSYEFDISENVNCLGDSSDVESEMKHTSNENIDVTQKYEVGAEDIAKELENLLSEDISDSKSEDDGTDITASDLDLSDAMSMNVDTSSSTKTSNLGRMSNGQETDSKNGQVVIAKKSLLIRLTDCLGKSVGIVSDNQTVDKSVQPLVIKLTNCLKDQIGHVEQSNAEDNLESSENNNEKEQTVLINSNVEPTESLLDITMEEFLSDFQKDEKEVDSQSTIILDDDDIKPKLEVIQIEENQLEEPKPLNQIPHNIGDEILELLKEVPVPALENADVPKQSLIQDNESDELKAAEDILKMMEIESSDDSSDSDIDDELHILSDTSIKDNDRNETTKESEKLMSQALAKHNMVSCYVGLERLQLPADDFVKYTRKLEDNIDWLCDLTTVNKRKGDGDLPFEKIKKTKKLRRENVSTGHSSSSSSDDSDLEVCGYRSGTPVLPKQVEEKLDVFLANVIARDLGGSNNDLDSGQSEDESDDSSKKKRKNKTASVNIGSSETDKIDETDTDTNNERAKLSKEELQKKAWKHDPLLRGNLSSHSDTDNSNIEKSSKKKEKRRRNEREDDFSVASDNLDSDSDLEGVREKNKSKLEENLISPIKRNIPSSDSSDSDSDIEFIPQKVRTPLKEGEAAGPSPSQKGRRNIRALMSQESLAEATKRANAEETERIERLKDRHKVIETFSQSFSQSQGQEEDGVPFILDVDETTGEPLVAVNPKITAKLKPHQKIGIQFMWDSCYESVKQMKKYGGSGCILAHCMGLGKTLQAITLIHTLFTYKETNTKHVLVVCPLSTVNNWLKEVKFAFEGIPKGPNFSVFTISGRNDKKYEIVKKWWLCKKALLIVGYESFEILTNDRKLEKVVNWKELILKALIDPGPDLVICDEGHLLRNKNALKSMALSKIRSKRRIILTGTPLQNNLLEYYHMVQFVKPDLLGNSKEFKTNFVNPITNGQYEDSTEDDIKLMMQRTHVLHKLLVKTVQRIEDTELEMYLPKMMDHALFIQLSQVQVQLYNHFSGIVKLKDDKIKHKGFLSDFLIFQYICTHPQILAIMGTPNKRTKERDVITNEDDQPICHLGSWWKEKLPEDAENKIEYGNKLVVLRTIIEACEEIGDKVLVFSQSLAELDLIEHFLITIGTSKCPSWKIKRDYSRMDGTVITENRTAICDKFNNTNNKTLRLLLMSTKVGGLGLNLTAANRVIIMTVNWNPSYDTQSVFRAYRFGQEKEVYVYRLISLDTMEEKVYHRTVTKLAIAHRVIDKHQVRRHYRRMHLQELYSCKPTADEGRPTPNVPEDQMLAKVILKLPCIFKFHEHKTLLENRPEDNLTEQELTSAWEAWKNNENAAQAAPSKAQAAPHPKSRVVPPPKTQAIPAQQTQAVPPQNTQTVPPQRTQTAPPQRLQTAPPQRSQTVPPQRTQTVPPQRNQTVPPQRTQAVPVPRILGNPVHKGQAVAPQWTTTVPQDLTASQAQTDIPPLAYSKAAVDFLVGRSNLNQLANTNLSRVSVSNVSLDRESRQYFFPKENNVTASSDLPNLPNINLDVTLKTKESLQSSNAKNSPPIGIGANHSSKLGRKLPTANTPSTSIINKQVVHNNGKPERELNLLHSPSILMANGDIPKPSLNTSGSAAEGSQRKRPHKLGLSRVLKNMKTLQENPNTSSPAANLPNVIKVNHDTPRVLLKPQRSLVPSQFPLGSQANIQKNPLNRNFTKSDGDSPNEPSNLQSKHTHKKNPASIQNKKNAPQRFGVALSDRELMKKKHTNENAIPSQKRQNSSVKRKIEVDSPSVSKTRKVASNVPSSDNRGIQTIIIDDLPKQRKKNRTGYTSDSRVASIRLDDIRDATIETSSDSGSLSSEIINSLKLSGVTVRRAQSNPKDVITLD